MGGAQPLARFAMKKFMKKQQVAPVRVGLMWAVFGKSRNEVGFIASENIRKPLGQHIGGIFKINLVAVQAGRRKSKRIAQVAMHFFDSLNQQVVGWHPYRSPPV